MKALMHWSLGVLLVMFLPALSVQAEVISEEQLTLVPTREVEPLQILEGLVNEQPLFTGEILSRRPLHADFLQFTLLDEFDGVVWRDNLKLPRQAQRIMPYSFDEINASGKLFLSVQAYDQFGNTAGSGHKYIEFPEKVVSITINSSEVSLNDQEELNVDMFVVNGPVRQTYIPRVQVYRDLAHFEDLIQTEELPFIDLQPGQQQQLNFKFPFKSPPGVYEIKMDLLNASNREPISSAHYRQIYRAGYFFKVVDLQSFYTAADKSSVRLKLDGLSTVVLTDPVQMRVRLSDKQNIYLDKNYSFTLTPGYFTKFVDLSLPSYVEQLNGTATFFLNGQKVQTIDFSDIETEDPPAELLALEAPEVVVEPIPPLVEKPEVWYLSDKAILGIVIGCTITLLLVVLVTWIKSRWLMWVLVPLISFGISVPKLNALTVGRDVFPMVEWSNFSGDEKLLFNPSSESGFQWLPVRGRVFNYLTQSALIKGDAFDQVRLNLTSPSSKTYQFQLSPELLKENTRVNLDSRSGDYFFILDLKALESAPTLVEEELLVWEDGPWQMQLIFPYQQVEQDTIYLATPLEDFAFFEIDQKPPLWQWQLKTVVGEVLSEADFTNQPVTVSITCQDQDSECVTPIQNFTVVGNFCEDALKCNTQAAREFEVCDIVGNCQTETITINGYDPVPPSVEALLINGAPATIATEEPSLSLRYADPNRVEASNLDLAFNTQICHEDNPFFRLNKETWQCSERLRPCVISSPNSIWRGEAYDDVCKPSCPEGFKFQDGNCKIICGDGGFEADRICLPFNLEVNET